MVINQTFKRQEINHSIHSGKYCQFLFTSQIQVYTFGAQKSWFVLFWRHFWTIFKKCPKLVLLHVIPCENTHISMTLTVLREAFENAILLMICIFDIFDGAMQALDDFPLGWCPD